MSSPNLQNCSNWIVREVCLKRGSPRADAGKGQSQSAAEPAHGDIAELHQDVRRDAE